jgi:putative ABC transport system substrate-binding protein
MRRREFIALIGGTVTSLTPVRSGTAQQPTKPYRIGILETIPPSLNAANLAAFRQGMEELGYVEGRNVVFEYRSADGASERFPALASELVGLNVHLIVTRGTPAAIAAKNATSTIPIIMAAIGEPIGPGVVAELARPGGNVTGLSAFVHELQGKRVELIKEMLPSMKKVGALLNMGEYGQPGGSAGVAGDADRRKGSTPRIRASRRAEFARDRVGFQARR